MCFPDLVRDDLPRVEAELFSEGAANGDLRPIGRRHQRDNNSWMHNTARLTKGKPRHHLLMHPADLSERGIEDGDIVEVRVPGREGRGGGQGERGHHARCGESPHGYGHQRGGVRLANASQVPGVSVNDLTDPERLDVASGNAALNGVPVQVSRI